MVDRAAAYDRVAYARLGNEFRFQRRRTPFLRIELLDVVHEVQPDRLGRAGIQRREHARLAIGIEYLDFLEPGIARKLRHVLDALARVEVFRRDRRQCDPLLQAFD